MRHPCRVQNGVSLVLDEIRVDRADGLARERLEAPCAQMSEADARTHFAFIVCQKPDDAVHGHADWGSRPGH